MHIKEMTIGGIPPFNEPVAFKLDERVNLFIGPNATGKSTMMRAMGCMIKNVSLDLYAPLDLGHIAFSEDWPLVKERSYDEHDREWELWFHELVPNFGEWKDWDAVPVIFIPSIRIGMNLQALHRTPAEFLSAGTAGLFSPGWHSRSVSVAEMLNPGADGWWPILYAEAVEHATALMMELEEVRRDANVWRNLESAVELAQKCAYKICGEVLSDGDLPEDWTDDGSSFYKTESGMPDRRVVTKHFTRTSVQNSDDPLLMSELSSGTEITIWWLRLIALNMVHHYGFTDNWQKQPAILLIDEIENHLHPTWQRRVIPALLEHFPGLQIFATTHSPFVVAGLKAGQVHLLNRDADGVITASTNTEDIVGWTMDEVLRTFMGVDDPTDERTAAAARELRELRDAGPSGDEQDEEQRQARMQELRRLVDRDLLAGGPKAAARELFEQQFAEALEKYRQAQELNQDGG